MSPSTTVVASVPVLEPPPASVSSLRVGPSKLVDASSSVVPSDTIASGATSSPNLGRSPVQAQTATAPSHSRSRTHRLDVSIGRIVTESGRGCPRAGASEGVSFRSRVRSLLLNAAWGTSLILLRRRSAADAKSSNLRRCRSLRVYEGFSVCDRREGPSPINDAGCSRIG